MAISTSILPEFEHEMANTRKILAIVPEGEAGWKPHPKSTSLGQLALHLSNIPHWTSVTIERTELDLAPPDGPRYEPPKFQSLAKSLAAFDDNVARGKAAIAGASDADWMVPWSLKFGGNTIFTLPRVAVLRSFVLSHMIHHRGQMTVYLRLRDVPLPGIYGPSADEQM
jgi:uncharacterized damage-inducible protein DinB